ncbi:MULTISPECIES: YidH family protein [unclassified Saccharothrix]|uniref:YidH family protein n=1 Tax=unclassified Saccharothrix TaxID=2593673 RepID=UPI00307FB80A
MRDLRLWFSPSRMLAEGKTPDYRFSLANERTFLAWIRTALALVGAGLAVDQFLPDLPAPLRTAVALTAVGLGTVCALRAVHHWVRCERAMRRGDPLPVTRFPALLAVLLFALSCAVIVTIVVSNP